MSSNKLVEAVAKGGSNEEIAQVSAAMVEADISKIESPIKQQLLVEVPDTSTSKKSPASKKKNKKNTIPQKPIDEVITLDDTIGPPVSEEILEMLEVEEKQEMVASYSTSGNTHQDGDNGDFLGFTPPSPSDEKDDFNFDTPGASAPSVSTSAQATPMAPMGPPGNMPTLPFGGNN